MNTIIFILISSSFFLLPRLRFEYKALKQYKIRFIINVVFMFILSIVYTIIFRDGSALMKNGGIDAVYKELSFYKSSIPLSITVPFLLFSIVTYLFLIFLSIRVMLRKYRSLFVRLIPLYLSIDIFKVTIIFTSSNISSDKLSYFVLFILFYVLIWGGLYWFYTLSGTKKLFEMKEDDKSIMERFKSEH